MKPCGRAQGRGIFLLDKLSQVSMHDLLVSLVSCQSYKLIYDNTLLSNDDMLHKKLGKDSKSRSCSAIKCRQQVVS